MNILGAIIRSDEIVGISSLHPCMEGKNFHYCFSIITKSTAVEFKSEVVEDVNIATKQEQQALKLFKEQYINVRKQIALHLGEPNAIIEEEILTQQVYLSFTNFCKITDHLEQSIKKLKVKNKEDLLQQLGDVWVKAKDITELITKN